MSKLPVMITVDSVADLPKGLAEKYNIMIHPYLVVTEDARFLDVVEVGAEHLLAYLNRNRVARSSTPPLENYVEFFAKCSELAEEIIHVTMGNRKTNGYLRASEAAKENGHVHVLESGLLSSAMGLVALRGAELAMAGNSVSEIIEKMNSYKKRVSSDFLVKDLEYMYRANRITKGVREMSYRFMFRPVLCMKNGEIAVKKILFGIWQNVCKRYIRKLFWGSKCVDRRRVFITYVGLDAEELEFITEEIRRCVQFEEIIYMKATASIACNCGKGTFGVLFGREAVTDVPENLLAQSTTGLGGYFKQHVNLSHEPGVISNERKDVVADDVEALVQPKGQMADAMTVIQRLDFLDYRTGLMYSAEDANLYLEILNEFVKDDKSISLNEFFAKESWEDYRILIHALKGTARIIGDMELSDAAKGLEFACKEDNEAYLKENHAKVMEQYSALRERIREVIE